MTKSTYILSSIIIILVIILCWKHCNVKMNTSNHDQQNKDSIKNLTSLISESKNKVSILEAKEKAKDSELNKNENEIIKLKVISAGRMNEIVKTKYIHDSIIPAADRYKIDSVNYTLDECHSENILLEQRDTIHAQKELIQDSTITELKHQTDLQQKSGDIKETMIKTRDRKIRWLKIERDVVIGVAAILTIKLLIVNY